MYGSTPKRVCSWAISAFAGITLVYSFVKGCQGNTRGKWLTFGIRLCAAEWMPRLDSSVLDHVFSALASRNCSVISWTLSEHLPALIHKGSPQWMDPQTLNYWRNPQGLEGCYLCILIRCKAFSWAIRWFLWALWSADCSRVRFLCQPQRVNLTKCGCFLKLVWFQNLRNHICYIISCNWVTPVPASLTFNSLNQLNGN